MQLKFRALNFSFLVFCFSRFIWCSSYSLSPRKWFNRVTFHQIKQIMKQSYLTLSNQRPTINIMTHNLLIWDYLFEPMWTCFSIRCGFCFTSFLYLFIGIVQAETLCASTMHLCALLVSMWNTTGKFKWMNELTLFFIRYLNFSFNNFQLPLCKYYS